MERYHVDLNDEEAALVASIQLHVSGSLDMDGIQEACLNNEGKVPILMELLLGRGAIPDHRWRYWSDPKYCTAQGKRSYEEIFASNGSAGREAYEHPHFLPFLRYFLFGCELRDVIVEEFESELAHERIRPEWFTSGDHDPMWKLARRLTRKYGLVREKHQASEEFMKLCLDMGFGLSVARSVRDEVMRVR